MKRMPNNARRSLFHMTRWAFKVTIYRFQHGNVGSKDSGPRWLSYYHIWQLKLKHMSLPGCRYLSDKMKMCCGQGWQKKTSQLSEVLRVLVFSRCVPPWEPTAIVTLQSSLLYTVAAFHFTGPQLKHPLSITAGDEKLEGGKKSLDVIR